VQGASPLGEYATPLGIIRSLVSIEGVRAALVRLPSWMPNLATHTARALELPGACWLGPCFSPSPVPDELITAQPPVLATCFSGLSAGTRRQVGSSLQPRLVAVARCTQLQTLLGAHTHMQYCGCMRTNVAVMTPAADAVLKELSEVHANCVDDDTPPPLPHTHPFTHPPLSHRLPWCRGMCCVPSTRCA
jgi:hypothetical protein